jgi:hypothetical protein
MNYGIYFSEELQKQGANWWNKVKVLKDGTRIAKNPLSAVGRRQINDSVNNTSRQLMDITAFQQGRPMSNNLSSIGANVDLPGYFFRKSKELAGGKHGDFDLYGLGKKMVRGQDGKILDGSFLVNGKPISIEELLRLQGIGSSIANKPGLANLSYLDFVRALGRPELARIRSNPAFMTRPVNVQ